MTVIVQDHRSIEQCWESAIRRREALPCWAQWLSRFRMTRRAWLELQTRRKER